MAITYNAGTNTITVTGYTEATPCNFTDIYNADVAGGWGKVTRQCTNQFCFSAMLCIGDGSTPTWFADSFVQVHWSNIWTAHFGYTIRNRVNSHVSLTRCSIIAAVASYVTYLGGVYGGYAPDFNLYDCSIMGVTTQRPLQIGYFTGEIERTSITDCMIHDTLNTDITNLIARLVTQANNPNSLETFVGGILNNITTYDAAIGVYMGGGSPSATFKNLIGENITTYDIRSHNNSSNHYFINTVFDSDAWRFDFNTYTGNCYRQYELDLKVIDKDNTPINSATVKIWDKDGNLIVNATTNTSGVIAAQTITRGYYNQANGNTLQEASPHLIKIEKASYTTYEADFTLDAKKDWLIALQTGGGGASLMRNPPLTGGMV